MTRVLPHVGRKTPRHRIFHRLRLPPAGLALITALSLLGQALLHAAMAADVEEVIVTAQRRSERLENVPMSVAVVTADTMTKSGATNLRDLNQLAPGLRISNSGFNTQPAIRGVSTTLAGNFYENNVAIYVDGLYQPDPVSANSDLANLADVQVLKGPQGTLYGRNATGGAILINTLAPSKTWTGNFSVSYAEYNEKIFSGYLSGPISDRIRFGIAAYSNTSDGYYKFSDRTTGLKTDIDSAPIKKQYVRAKIEADITDSLTATVGYNYIFFSDGTPLQYTPFNYIAPTFPAPPLRSPDPLNTKSANYRPIDTANVNEATLKFVWKTEAGTLTSTSGYSHQRSKSHFDIDGSYSDLSNLLTIFPRDVYQTNLNYNLTAIKNLDLLVGGTYYKQHVYTDGYGIFANGALVTINDQKTNVKAYSIYVDGTYRLTDAITLAAGGAYAHETAAVNFSSRTPAQVIAGTYNVAPIGKSTSFKKFTPRASLRYEFMPEANVYFSYSQGFKAGTWQIGSAPVTPVRQETINAYELGIKMVQPTVRLEAAGFYYDYKDIQSSVTIPDPACPTPPNCNLRVLLFNGPSASIYGIDGQATWTPVERLNIRLGAAWLRARYGTFTNAVGTGVNTTTGVLVPNQTQDWSHKQMPRSPTFSGNVGVDYDVVTSLGDILFSANTSFTASYVTGNASLYGPLAGALANQQHYRQSAYALVNGTITWTDPAGRLSLSLFGRNLTNKKYFFVFSSSGSFGDYGVYGPPRVIGGRAQYHF